MIGPNSYRISGFAAVLLLAASALPQSAAYDVWAKLGTGQYRCGFRSGWLVDYGHRYQAKQENGFTFGDQKAPRPVLMNVWYPADSGGDAMTLGSYYDLAPLNSSQTKLTQALVDYSRGVVAEDVFGKAFKELNDKEKALHQELLMSRTHSRRGATPAPGRFPIVIMHSGYGSSYADNILMAEYLAGRGYIVVGSSFNRLDGTSFNIEGKEGASYDIQTLLRAAAQIPEADWSRVGYVGHSGGAHAGMIYQSLDGGAIDATVCLDTTEDYYSVADPRWDYMRKPVLLKKESMTRPMLIMAGPEASFEFVDSLTATPRWLFTVDGTSHNDFVSHGVYAQWAALKLAAPEKMADARKAASTVWDRHAQICQVTGDFLDAKLSGKSAAFEARLKADASRGYVYDATHLESVGVGVSGPSLDVPGVPTPRQMRPLLRTEGAAKVAERLKGAAKDHPVLYPVYGFALIFQLVQEGNVEDARIMYDAYRALKIDVAEPFLSQGKMYKSIGRLEFARLCFKNLLAVDPGQEEAKKELESMKEPDSPDAILTKS